MSLRRKYFSIFWGSTPVNSTTIYIYIFHVKLNIWKLSNVCCSVSSDGVFLLLMILDQKSSLHQLKNIMFRSSKHFFTWICYNFFKNKFARLHVSNSKSQRCETKFLQAYLFNDYWEDIGTIRSFFEANLALTEHVRFLCHTVRLW